MPSLTANQALAALCALRLDYAPDTAVVDGAWVATCPVCRHVGALRIREREDVSPVYYSGGPVTVGCVRRCAEPSVIGAVLAQDPDLLEARADAARWRSRYPRSTAQDEAMDDVQALSRDQLAALITMVPTSSRLLVEVIASTGLRISEAIALQRGGLILDGDRPSLRVRRAIVKGTVCAPKSKYGRRTVLIPLGLADRLSEHIARLDPRPDQFPLHIAARHATRPRQPAQADAEAAHGGDRRAVGRVAHTATHLRLGPAR